MPSSFASSSTPCVLLTGFDAFDGATLNPSSLAVRALDGERLAGHRIVSAELPTVFGSSLSELQHLVRRHRPALVICVGQAGGRPAISLERVAINVDDARIPDNSGARPIDLPVIAGGPAAYFSSLPIKAMLQALQQAGIAAEVSQTAGTFVCNHVFYGLMRLLAAQEASPRTRGGFIHVPWLPEQGAPAMALEDITRGLRIAVGCALMTPHDAAISAGALN
jgi:pyroglutamyl-peptidase